MCDLLALPETVKDSYINKASLGLIERVGGKHQVVTECAAKETTTD
jgi:hypothetical protein